MKTNVGSFDAAVRFVAGFAFMFFGLRGLGWWALLGVLPILTMIAGFCPIYWLFGINTAAWEEAFEARHHHPPHHGHPHR